MASVSAALFNQGKVVYVGSSNFAGWDIATACQEASKRGMMGLASEQSIYHLNNRMIELEVIPAMPRVRSRSDTVEPIGRRPSGRRSGEERNTDGVPARICENAWKTTATSSKPTRASAATLGEPPAAVALAWLLHNPVVTAPIIGPRTMEQLESAVRATEIELDAETLHKLDEIFPGPGGEAPKAYAW